MTASLDGLRFRVVENEAGEVDGGTVFDYRQEGDLVHARYAGGAVRLGFLVGLRSGDAIEFRYAHVNVDGETAAGHCRSSIETLPDGRLRLHERWAWDSREGSGTSVVEQV